MMSISEMRHKLVGVSEDTDRHGNVRRYYRSKGRKKVRLRGEIGTVAFAKEYDCAVLGLEYIPDGQEQHVPAIINEPASKGSLRWLCEQYFKSGKFNDLGTDSKDRRRAILNRICDEKGDLPFAQMRARHVVELRDKIMHTPGAANNRVKNLSVVFNWAIKPMEYTTYNPAAGIDPLHSGDGFHTWTIEEVEQYVKYHGKLSKATFALVLALFTGLRRQSIAILGRQHFKDGWIRIQPEKTKKSSGVIVEIPVLPVLQNYLDNFPIGNMTILVTEYGSPYTPDGLGNRMRSWCDQADLPKCSLHGLRKAGASIAAENSATEEELKAIYGWTTSEQVALYTRNARRKKLAENAMYKLAPEQFMNENVPLFLTVEGEWDKSRKKINENK